MAEKPTYEDLEKKVQDLEKQIGEMKKNEINLHKENNKRKIMEKVLEENEHKYRGLFEKMQCGCALHEIICDEKGKPVSFRYLDVNPAFEKITGHKINDIIGRDIMEILPGIDSFLVETYGKVAITGEPVFFEHYVKETDRYFEITAYQPQEKQFVIIFQEITERKKTEKDLKESREYLKNLMENTSDYIMISDKNGCPEIFNSAYANVMKNVFGIEMRPGMKSHALLPDKKEASFWDDIHERVLNGEKIQTEYAYWLSNKKTRHFEFSFNPIVQDEKVTGFTEISRDITERKEMENAQKKARDELEDRVKERTQELKEAYESLYEKTTSLQEVNTALKVLLEKRDRDREENGKKVVLNVKELLVPYIEKLKKGPLTESQSNYVELLESGLKDIISPFAHKITASYMNLTPRELQVANLVKEGKSSKEIADIFNCTERAVVAHRANLRKKLGLKKKSNLRTYLLSMQ